MKDNKQHTYFLGDLHPNFEGEPEKLGEFVHGFSPVTFAKLHRVHPNTVYRWIHRGLIKAKKVKIYERHRYVISLFAVNPTLKSGPIPRDMMTK